MHSLAFLILAAASCMAYHQGYDIRSRVRRYPTQNEDFTSEDKWVSCPVCAVTGPDTETCIEGKKFCPYGTYKNEKCGGRDDCYRGPGETCTEKRIIDDYGWRCAHSLSCSEPYGTCFNPIDHLSPQRIAVINRNRMYHFQ